MRRAPVLVALAFVLALAPPAAATAAWTEAPLAFVILSDDAPAPAREFVDVLAEAGGHVSVLWPPHVALVRAEPAVLARPDVAAWIDRAETAAVDPAALPGRPAAVRQATLAWNALLAMLAETAAAGPSAARHDHLEPPREQFPDARHVPVDLPHVPDFRDAPDHIPYGAQYYDTSSYLAGSTAVGLWLLEAAGSTYDWSTTEESDTIAGVLASFDDWVVYGGAEAFLTFVLETHTGVPVSGVPIENPQSMEATWIGEALTNAGWTGVDAYDQCFAYNNSIRNTYETNWCYSIFICDSDPAVNQGLFSTGGYAWAYFGGPWVWMSRYSTWAYNSANYFECVPMHEMGHIFYATDEYDGIQQWSGYLNRNDTLSNGVLCLMNQNRLDFLCGPTRRQVAWRDQDSDGVIDPLDVEPSATPDELLPDPTSNPTPTWTGHARVNTLDNLNPNDWRYSPPHDVTIVTIDAVECRVDGGAWSAATPVDGTFDAYEEDFTWTSPPLADGVHLVEARALTSVGIWTTVFDSDEITVSGSPVGAPLVAGAGETLRVSPNPARGGVELSWRAPGGPVSVTVFDAAGRRVLTERSAAPEGRLAWDGRDDRDVPVAAGVYLVRLEGEGVSETRRFVLLR